MMNRDPYAVRHQMAVQYRKVAELSALGENEAWEPWNLVTLYKARVLAEQNVHAFNIGLAAETMRKGCTSGWYVGECAGAGVPDHLHIHIVPRWRGDTNFMPILAVTRMLSEGLLVFFFSSRRRHTRS